MTAKSTASEKQLTVKLIKRPGSEKHRRVTFSMGLRKINAERTYPDRPEIRGMIFAVKHLLEVTEEG